METLLACERSDCESRHGGAFSCLHKPVLREVEREVCAQWRESYEIARRRIITTRTHSS